MCVAHWQCVLIVYIMLERSLALQNASVELFDNLLKDYNSKTSPYVSRRSSPQNSSNALSVSLRLSRVLVMSVNERDDTISILLTVNYAWTDPRLTWDPSTTDDIDEISIKSDYIWQPDVYPCEAVQFSFAQKDMPNSASIRSDGRVSLYNFLSVNYICEMEFDEFPFDTQQCSICLALDGLTSISLNLLDISDHPIDLRSNSEWDVLGNITVDSMRTTLDNIQTHRLLFNFTIKRRAFFWIFLIIVPTLLFCLVTLFGVFFYEGDDAVLNAASIGLTTMTSLMLVVTILSDALDKSDNLPGLGWFVFVEIVVVCLSVIAVLLLDGARSLALSNNRGEKKGGASMLRFLTSKSSFRAMRITLFLLSIVALVLNAVICCT